MISRIGRRLHLDQEVDRFDVQIAARFTTKHQFDINLEFLGGTTLLP
jgi:hypothetical protein